MPINCDPKALDQAAACFNGILPGDRDTVIIYLLNQLLGSGLTPKQLMQAAACFDGIPHGMRDAVMTYLLCQIANGPGVGFQDALLRLTPPMTDGFGGSGFTMTVNAAANPFSGTVIQYLGTILNSVLTVANAANLVTLDFPNLKTINSSAAANISITTNPSLTTINLPKFVPTNGKTFSWGPAPINAASVNGFLARCVANPAYVSGTILFANAGVSAPTGQGLVDKVTLQGRGVAVNTN